MMFDPLELHKAYFVFLSEPEYRTPEYFAANEDEAMLVHLEWNLYQEKQAFTCAYAHFKNKVFPVFRNKHRIVYVPELGGHVNMIDYDGYFEAKEAVDEQWGKCERAYSHVKDTERWINEKKQEIFLKKERQKDKQFLSRYRDKLMEAERWVGHKNPVQMELF